MPGKRLMRCIRCVASRPSRASLSPTRTKSVSQRLFVPRAYTAHAPLGPQNASIAGISPQDVLPYALLRQVGKILARLAATALSFQTRRKQPRLPSTRRHGPIHYSRPATQRRLPAVRGTVLAKAQGAVQPICIRLKVWLIKQSELVDCFRTPVLPPPRNAPCYAERNLPLSK